MGADYWDELERPSSQSEAPLGAHIRDHKQNPIENGAQEPLTSMFLAHLMLSLPHRLELWRFVRNKQLLE